MTSPRRTKAELLAELYESREQQAATSAILSVIVGSPTNVQPVFDAIVESAARLCGARVTAMFLVHDDLVHLAAHHDVAPGAQAETARELRRTYPHPLSKSESLSTRAIVEKSIVHVPDLAPDPDIPEASLRLARTIGYRSLLSVPMVREGLAIGTISAAKVEPGPFSEMQIALLQTFANQGVIAIENARLIKELEARNRGLTTAFADQGVIISENARLATELQARTRELTRSVDRLTALGAVGQAVGSSLELETVLATIVSRAVELTTASGGTIWEYDEATEEFTQRTTQNVDDRQLVAPRSARLRKGEGAVGRLAVTHAPVQIADITVEGAYDSRLRDILVDAGTRALLAVPILREGRVLGGLVISRRTPGEFSADVVELLQTFATQSALAIQNARLFREIEVKSRELAAASQHKSEFLANMSHELRTPLNGIIGFSEVMLERMFGEINEKQEEYLNDILTSGRHLLSLINDILDLSKIEAGRMELEVSDFHLPSAVDNAVTLVRERATRRGLTLSQEIDEQVASYRGDERKIKQVMLNLLSNAVKFTPEGGSVTVRATRKPEAIEIAVNDTGIGIAPEEQAAVFEEFRQVGSDMARKHEGTGLGLALAKRFVELHGGRIWLESEVARGSSFTFTLPLRS